jgi:hypothetical protein
LTITKIEHEPLGGTVFWALYGTLAGSRQPVSSLRKLMAMRSSGRAGFRREFLEIKGIERNHSMHTVSASPTNEGF